MTALWFYWTLVRLHNTPASAPPSDKIFVVPSLNNTLTVEKCHLNGLDPEIRRRCNTNMSCFAPYYRAHFNEFQKMQTRSDSIPLSFSLRLTLICLFFGSWNKSTRSEITNREKNFGYYNVRHGIPCCHLVDRIVMIRKHETKRCLCLFLELYESLSWRQLEGLQPNVETAGNGKWKNVRKVHFSCSVSWW